MKNITSVLVFFLFLVGCSDVPRGYEKYRTFDEYSLQGVGKSDTIQTKPYVAAKFDEEKISVLIFDKNGKIRKMEYFNKGEYWYSSYKLKLESFPKCRCDTTPAFFEKFIFNDTIMVYHYINHSVGSKKIKVIESLYYITKEDFIILSDTSPLLIDSTNIFKSLSNKRIELKNQYTQADIGRDYNPRIFSTYSKGFKGDTMFVYERDETNNQVLSSKHHVLTTLGEYGVLTAWSIQ